MSRKRHNSYQRPRQLPNTERSYLAYQYDVPAQATSRTELVRLLRGGEDTYLELKVRFSNPEKLTAEIIALANTDGGALIFGVNDQLRIEGVDDPESVEEQLRELCATQIQPPVFPYINKVAFDSGRRVVVLEVEPHSRPHRTRNDEFFLREGAIKRETTREELSQIYGEAPQVKFEQAPIFKAHIDSDIDESLFWSYVRGVNPSYGSEKAKGFPTGTLLCEMGLALKLKDEFIPTVGGLLLFGLNERVAQLLPQAGIQLTRYSGTDLHAPIVERVEIAGNLLRLFDGTFHFIKRYADLWEVKPNRKAIGDEGARANYLNAAVSEAITNALVHRAWQVRDRLTRVYLFDDAIEIINPTPLLDLPVSSLRYGITQTHNPRLKAVFTNVHYGAHVTAGGLPAMFTQAAELARRLPEGPTYVNHDFRVKLYGWH